MGLQPSYRLKTALPASAARELIATANEHFAVVSVVITCRGWPGLPAQ